MELAGLEVALGESLSECEGLGHHCSLCKHCPTSSAHASFQQGQNQSTIAVSAAP